MHCFAGHIDCALSNWRSLTRYLDDGHVPIDSNAQENAVRSLWVACPKCGLRDTVLYNAIGWERNVSAPCRCVLPPGGGSATPPIQPTAHAPNAQSLSP